MAFIGRIIGLVDNAELAIMIGRFVERFGARTIYVAVRVPAVLALLIIVGEVELPEITWLPERIMNC